MDTDQLLAFEHIVREGSFSCAAGALNIAQPTMSARIQGLEGEVGGALFVRGGRNIALTERGESFLPYARRALAVLAEGIEVAQLTQAGKRGWMTPYCCISLRRVHIIDKRLSLVLFTEYLHANLCTARCYIWDNDLYRNKYACSAV